MSRDNLDALLAILHACLNPLGFAHYQYGVRWSLSDIGTGFEIWCSSLDEAGSGMEPPPHHAADAVLAFAHSRSEPVYWHNVPDAGQRPRHGEAPEAPPRAGVAIPVAGLGPLEARFVLLHDAETSPDAFAEAWQKNGELATSAIQAFAKHLDLHAVISAQYRLSPRERDVLAMLLCGQTKKQIAHASDRLAHTVEKQIAAARRRMRAQTVPQAVAKALFLGLI